ncbi:MAG: glycosyltransferase, partial [Acidobacteriota bacterium]|nr:glycosyltransferase [Acidobacteriota bacterium]
LKQEHFGMSIVEAMSAGVVPLAFNGGGPRETVVPEVSGFLWTNPGKLSAYTCRLMRDDLLRERMSKEAVLNSRRFTHGEFQVRMDAIVARVTAPLPEASISCAY